MAKTPDHIVVKVVPQAVFQPAGTPRPSCAGPSLLEQMWSTLLEEMDAIMPGGDYHEDAFEGHEAPQDEQQMAYAEWRDERARIQGACQGIAVCIALVQNPYRPNIDEVRTEAAMRWADREVAAELNRKDA